MPAKKDEDPAALIRLPIDQFLDKVGGGGHKPGSGTAAALLSLIACKLLQTVITLSHGRAEYKGVTEQLTLANQAVLESIWPRMLKAFHDDSVQFHKVISARRARDAEDDPKVRRTLNENALEELKLATTIPLEISQLSLDLADRALAVFDLGFQSARGDSTVAISAALAGATGTIGVVYLNLTSFKGGEWAVDIRKKADAISVRAQAMQVQLVQRIARLHDEAVERESTP